MLRYKTQNILQVAFFGDLICLYKRLVERKTTLEAPHVYMKSVVVWIFRVPFLKGTTNDFVNLVALATHVFFVTSPALVV